MSAFPPAVSTTMLFLLAAAISLISSSWPGGRREVRSPASLSMVSAKPGNSSTTCLCRHPVRTGIHCFGLRQHANRDPFRSPAAVAEIFKPNFVPAIRFKLQGRKVQDRGGSFPVVNDKLVVHK